MEKIFKERLLKELRPEWEYCHDVKIKHLEYVAAFMHKQTKVVRVVKFTVDFKTWSNWPHFVNEQLRVYEYRKWKKALRSI